MYFISYDISSASTRTTVYKILCNYGTRIQRSSFECAIDYETMHNIIKKIVTMLDDSTDSLIVFYICKKCHKKTIYAGNYSTALPEAFIIV